MLSRSVVLAAAIAAVASGSSAARASGPTVPQIKAAIATHSANFILANAYAYDGQPPGHAWIDVKTGAGRWVSANGKLVSLVSVSPDPHDPALFLVSDTNINYTTRTWSRRQRQESAKIARPEIVDPLEQASPSSFRLLGVQTVDGRQTHHLRSTYFPYHANTTVRLDVWFSADQDYLIRYTRTTPAGKVISRVDNHWLPRTPAELALLTARIPRGFRHVSS